MSPSKMARDLVAGPDDAGRRLDKVLRSVLRESSLSEIYAALRKGRILVNGAKARPDLRLAAGDRISLTGFELGSAVSAAHGAQGEAADSAQDGLRSISDILILATIHLVFVNKPRGELSQGPEGIEGRIRAALAGSSAASLSFRPGPLHRLDRNTTGIMTFPRSAEGARTFTALLRERRLVKRYLALVDGEIEGPSEWVDRLERDQESLRSVVSDQGREARAEALPLLRGGGRSLLLVRLHSGLTHQIRAQAASRAHPLSGDVKYGGSPLPGGYILHALSLEFPEPPFPDVPASILAPLPPFASARLEAFFGLEAVAAALERATRARSG